MLGSLPMVTTLAATGCGAVSRVPPQLLQNLLPAGLAEPQLGQVFIVL